MQAEQLTTLALRVVAVIIGAYACADAAYVATYAMGLFLGGQAATELRFVGKSVTILWSVPIIVAIGLPGI